MGTNSVKLVVFFVLLVHGIGHLQGVVSSLGVRFTASTSSGSWLLNSTGDTFNKILCLFFYLVTSFTGIMAALSFKGILLPSAWWETLALFTAFLSAFSLIVFPNALAMAFNKAGAVIVDLVIFYSLLFNGQWPTAIFEN